MSLIKKSFTLGKSTFECWIYITYNSLNNIEFWFKGENITEFLEYKNSRNAIINHVMLKWRKSWSELCNIEGVNSADTLTQMRTDVIVDTTHTRIYDDVITINDKKPSNLQPHTVFISEPGIYALVANSKKAGALKFTSCLYKEVLPSLCRKGLYSMDSNKSEIYLELKNEIMQIKIEKMEIQMNFIQYRAAAEKQLINAEKQLALQVESSRCLADEEVHKLQIQLLQKTQEMQTREQEFRHDQTKLIHEFKNIILYGVRCTAEAEMHAETQEERADVAVARGIRMADHSNRLNDTASIAPIFRAVANVTSDTCNADVGNLKQHRMITRKRAREQTMRRIMSSFNETANTTNLETILQNIKRWLKHSSTAPINTDCID